MSMFKLLSVLCVSLFTTISAQAESVKVTILDPGGASHCTGTLLKTDWVLIAAHCMGGTISDVIVSSTSHLSKVDDIVVHGDYIEGQLVGDVALIHLVDPFPIEPNVKLDPEGLVSIAPGETVYTKSWAVLGHVFNPIFHEEALIVEEVNLTGFITTTINQTEKLSKLCVGESGSGLYNSAGTLVGILSGVLDESCTLLGDKQFYTPIASFRNWIEIASGGA